MHKNYTATSCKHTMPLFVNILRNNKHYNVYNNEQFLQVQ